MPRRVERSGYSRSPSASIDAVSLREVTTSFIETLADWQWFVTLTFKRDVYPKTAHMAVKEFLHKIAKDHERQHLQVAWGCGRQTGGRLHYHLLVAPLGGGDLSTEVGVIERLWRWGNRKVEHVHDRTDVAGYLTKHEFWIAAVACDRTLPCRRKHGCRHDVPWPSVGEYLTET